MSTVEMRAEIDGWLDAIQKSDQSLFKAVHAMLGTYAKEQDDPILGYEVDGTPVTASAFLKQADEAMEAVERGEYITAEELEKESAKWLEKYTK